jgi:hypothetical protein
VVEVTELELHACWSTEAFNFGTNIKMYRTQNSSDAIPGLHVGVVYRTGTAAGKYYAHVPFVNK